MNDLTHIPTDLDALRQQALASGDDQVALLCLASKAMYHKLQTTENRNGELSTVMIQLSSLLHVPNKRKANKDDLLTLLENARDMIAETLTPAEATEHA